MVARRKSGGQRQARCLLTCRAGRGGVHVAEVARVTSSATRVPRERGRRHGYADVLSSGRREVSQRSGPSGQVGGMLFLWRRARAPIAARRCGRWIQWEGSNCTRRCQPAAHATCKSKHLERAIHQGIIARARPHVGIPGGTIVSQCHLFRQCHCHR